MVDGGYWDEVDGVKSVFSDRLVRGASERACHCDVTPVGTRKLKAFKASEQASKQASEKRTPRDEGEEARARRNVELDARAALHLGQQLFVF